MKARQRPPPLAEHHGRELRTDTRHCCCSCCCIHPAASSCQDLYDVPMDKQVLRAGGKTLLDPRT
jgi:hypothetical protein